MPCSGCSALHGVHPNLKKSKKTDLTSRGGLQSKAWNISCVIASSWFIQESDGRKPEWLGLEEVSNFLEDYFSKVLPKMDNRDIDW